MEPLLLFMDGRHTNLTWAVCWGAGSERKLWQLTPHPRTPVGAMLGALRGWGAGRHPPRSPHLSPRMLRRASWRLGRCLMMPPTKISTAGATTTIPGKSRRA